MFISNIGNRLRSVKDNIMKFLRNQFEITGTKRSKIAGLIVGAATLLMVILNVGTFVEQEFKAKWILLAAMLICPFILGYFTAYTIRIKNEKYNRIWHMVLLFLMPILAMTMTEALNDVFVYNMTYLGFLGNYLVIGIMYFLVYAISGSMKISYLVITPILFGFGVAHSYIMDFRGTPFQPMDFLSVTTAAGVANTYDYSLTYKIISGAMVFIFIMLIGIKTKTPKYNFAAKIASRTFTGVFSFVLVVLFYFTTVFADLGVRPDFWNQTRGYRNYGFVFSFFSNTKYLYVSEPEGYDSHKVKEHVDKINGSNEQNNTIVGENANHPNIICIMNESLSDLQVLGDFETNEDYMPFMRSLTENTVKGNLYVPVIGAGTSNTEFEFLTGHTTAFLPSGSNAYMLYVDEPIASMVSTLKAQGYSSYAMHPYFAKGWERTKVYRNFAFDAFDSIEDLLIPEVMQKYNEYSSEPDYLQSVMDEYYPGESILIRQYVSDEYNYDVLIDNFEKRDKSVPYYAFNVTMQNHGGYTTSSVNFDENIYVTDASQKYIKVDKYLSLVKKSDDAFKGLIEYFSNVEEPTIICMFGDHQPTVESEFIAEVLGERNLMNLTTEQEQARHCTQFYIWANYDIEEREIERLSANYLSSLVMDIAGVELTEYNKYLLNLSQTLPVIDTVGYIDNEGTYYKWSESSPYADLLKEYEYVQYNNIFDQDDVESDVFYLEGYEHKATTFDMTEEELAELEEENE